MDIIQNILLRARKDYPCDACEIIKYEKDHVTLQKEELHNIEVAQSHGWKILKGEMYRKTVYKYDNRIWVARSIPAIHQICSDNDLFGQD